MGDHLGNQQCASGGSLARRRPRLPGRPRPPCAWGARAADGCCAFRCALAASPVKRRSTALQRLACEQHRRVAAAGRCQAAERRPGRSADSISCSQRAPPCSHAAAPSTAHLTSQPATSRPSVHRMSPVSTMSRSPTSTSLTGSACSRPPRIARTCRGGGGRRRAGRAGARDRGLGGRARSSCGQPARRGVAGDRLQRRRCRRRCCCAGTLPAVLIRAGVRRDAACRRRPCTPCTRPLHHTCAAAHRDVAGHRLQRAELLLLLVVVHGGDQHHQGHCVPEAA